MSTTVLFSENIFGTRDLAITGTAANGGLSLAIAVGAACSTSTVGCAAGGFNYIYEPLTSIYYITIPIIFVILQGHTV